MSLIIETNYKFPLSSRFKNDYNTKVLLMLLNVLGAQLNQVYRHSSLWVLQLVIITGANFKVMHSLISESITSTRFGVQAVANHHRHSTAAEQLPSVATTTRISQAKDYWANMLKLTEHVHPTHHNGHLSSSS